MTDEYTQADAWIEAARPKTLGASVSPVLVGTALALGHGGSHLPAAGCALAGALLMTRYPITRERYEEIQQKLKALESQEG